MSKKFYTARNDKVFKALFCDEDDTYLLKEFLSRLLNKNVKAIRFLRNELISNNVLSKNKCFDLLAIVDDMYVHIEINTLKNKKYLHVRNFTYFSEIYNKKTLKGEEYKYSDEYLHIDLTYNMSNKEKLIGSYYVMDKDRNKYIENFEIKEYNMDKIKKFWYNKDIEKINKYLHLIILDLNDVELEELIKLVLPERDELFVKTYYERTKDMNDDEYFRSQISYEEDLWRCANTEKRIAREEGFEEGCEEGLEQGIEQGIKQKTKEAVINMLNNNLDDETIMKYLGIDKETLTALKSSL